MSSIIERENALSRLELLRQSWQNNHWANASAFLADDIVLVSSNREKTQGINALIKAFECDHSPQSRMNIITSNHYVVAEDDSRAMVSAYLYGEKTDASLSPNAAVFGSTLRLTLCFENNDWKISHILMSINWLEGNSRLMPHWTLPPGQNGWRPGDAPPVLISELDAPWHIIRKNLVTSSEEIKIAEAYSRYSWAIDQNDFGLFITCYTEDAEGEFQPLGYLQGLHSIAGSLKEFRRHWPWMQHFGVALKTTINPEAKTAEMWIGRLIPGNIVTETGEALYGAHYRIELRKESGIWKFSWSEYNPGWFTESTAPYLNQ